MDKTAGAVARKQGAVVAARVRALLKRSRGTPGRGSLDKAAGRFLRRHVELKDILPFHDAPAARAEHAGHMSRVQEALAKSPRVTISGRGTPECHRRRDRAVEALARP